MSLAGKKKNKEYENTFSVFSLITHEEINIQLFGVFMIVGKQKTPDAIHDLNQSEI